MTDEEKVLQGLPEEMCEGSSGSIAGKVNGFLLTYFASDDPTLENDFQVTDLYGPEAVVLMKEFQRLNGLRQTGSCDLLTRAKMKELGSDFELFAASSSGRTTFVRSDGSHLVWWPKDTK